MWFLFQHWKNNSSAVLERLPQRSSLRKYCKDCPEMVGRAVSTPSHPLRKQNKLTQKSRQDALRRIATVWTTPTNTAICKNFPRHFSERLKIHSQGIRKRSATDPTRNSDIGATAWESCRGDFSIIVRNWSSRFHRGQNSAVRKKMENSKK